MAEGRRTVVARGGDASARCGPARTRRAILREPVDLCPGAPHQNGGNALCRFVLADRPRAPRDADRLWREDSRVAVACLQIGRADADRRAPAPPRPCALTAGKRPIMLDIPDTKPFWIKVTTRSAFQDTLLNSLSVALATVLVSVALVVPTAYLAHLKAPRAKPW